MKQSAVEDPVMSLVRELWSEKRKQGMTQEALGLGMGYEAESARQSVHRFLKTRDPHISMLRRFAKAIKVPLSDLIVE